MLYSCEADPLSLKFLNSAIVLLFFMKALEGYCGEKGGNEAPHTFRPSIDSPPVYWLYNELALVNHQIFCRNNRDGHFYLLNLDMHAKRV